MKHRVLIGVAIPILWLILAGLGRTRAAARDIARPETARPPAERLLPTVSIPKVRLAQLRPAKPIIDPVSFRNPFTFAPRTLVPTPPPSPIPVAPPPEESSVTPPSVALSLIGVATASRADGRVERTAILIGSADALYLVREGDAIVARYRVDAVLPDRVRLVDDKTGALLLLLLR